jgi:hypothetical protein
VFLVHVREFQILVQTEISDNKVFVVFLSVSQANAGIVS